MHSPETHTRILTQFDKAQELETFLGNPLNADTVLSFEHSVALDEQEAYPEQCIQLLNDWGLHQYYIPEQLGGKLRSIEELFSMARTISRRDLTTVISHAVTFLGAIDIWIGGSFEQQKALAAMIKERKIIALSLTEKKHGSDLMSNEVCAEAYQEGYKINGEKWLFNQAHNSSAVTMLVKTDTSNTPRSYSLFFINKDEVATGQLSSIGKIKTHGVRGMDMGGLTLQDAILPKETRIGKKGAGLEIAIKGLQVTRMLCASFSMGAMDTALRTVIQFAVQRELYGDSIIQMPRYKNSLVKIFTKVLISECLSFTSARALHVIPKQFTVISAIVKSSVPVFSEAVLQELTHLFGARYYLREEFNFGIFQKVLRDNATVSLFDGNTAVNQHAILLQLKYLAYNRSKEWNNRSAQIIENHAVIYDLSAPLPSLDFSKLDVISKGKDDLIFGLKMATEKITQELEETPLDHCLLQRIQQCLQKIEIKQKALDATLLSDEVQLGNVYAIPALYYTYAEQYGYFHMAASCVQIWHHNKTVVHEHFNSPVWVLACLTFICEALDITVNPLTESEEDLIVDAIVELYHKNQLFSIIPQSLAV